MKVKIKKGSIQWAITKLLKGKSIIAFNRDHYIKIQNCKLISVNIKTGIISEYNFDVDDFTLLVWELYQPDKKA